MQPDGIYHAYDYHDAEGIMQSSTKIDSGFVGTLNWGIRNSSIRDFVLGFSETDLQTYNLFA